MRIKTLQEQVEEAIENKRFAREDATEAEEGECG